MSSSFMENAIFSVQNRRIADLERCIIELSRRVRYLAEWINTIVNISYDVEPHVLENLQDAIHQRVEGEDTGGSESDEEDPEHMDVEHEILGKSIC